MSDTLLPYYDRELNAIRRLAADFAAAHPKIAGRLRLTPDAVDDPHVARLLEGTAFLAARVHHRLDDEFPELTDALLGVLYPHYLAPAPSAAILQFEPQPDLALPVRLVAGTALETEPVRGEPCRFQTAWPLTLWPIEIESVRLSGLPLSAPANPLAGGALAVLRIVLKCSSGDVSFASLGVDRLRFFLRGAANVALPLYELLCAHTISLAYADGQADPAPVIVTAAAIEPAGFAPEEALFPWPARSFVGFRLLTEYFAFPEKFLFVDFTRIEAKTLLSGGNRMEIFVYLDRALPELERTIGADALALGCVPIVNLFTQRCEPVSLTHTASCRTLAVRRQWRSGRSSEYVKPVPTAALDPGAHSIASLTPIRMEIRRGAFTTPFGAIRRRRLPAARCISPRTIPASTPRRRPRPFCRSMLSASTATCRRLFHSEAVVRKSVSSKAPPQLHSLPV
jgi:type VI secretion system protein ImpG